VDEMPRQCRALLLVGAYAGLRVGRRGSGLRRREIDPTRSRIRITSTAVELRGHVTSDNEPKTTRSKRHGGPLPQPAGRTTHHLEHRPVREDPAPLPHGHHLGPGTHSKRWPACAMPPQDTNWHMSGHEG
jgi:hypothetical protein